MPANLSRLAILSIFRDRDVLRPYPLHFTEISQAVMSPLSRVVFASSADRSSTLMRCIGEQAAPDKGRARARQRIVSLSAPIL